MTRRIIKGWKGVFVDRAFGALIEHMPNRLIDPETLQVAEIVHYPTGENLTERFAVKTSNDGTHWFEVRIKEVQ